MSPSQPIREPIKKPGSGGTGQMTENHETVFNSYEIVHNTACKIKRFRLKVNPIPYSSYTYRFGLCKLETEFTMTQKLLQAVSDDGKRIPILAKFVLACLITSSLKTSTVPRILTSTRRLYEHFNITPWTIYRILNILQNTKIQGTPLINCHPYNPKDMDVKDISGLRLNEKPIEILLPVYQFVRYNKEDKSDNFFFDLDVNWGASELTIAERVILFQIQNLTQQACKKGKPPESRVRLKTYTKLYNVRKPYVSKLLTSLKRKGFIEYNGAYDKTTVTLTTKGTRPITRFSKDQNTQGAQDAQGAQKKHTKQPSYPMEQGSEKTVDKEQETRYAPSSTPNCIPGSAEEGRKKLEEIQRQWAERKKTEQDEVATDI